MTNAELVCKPLFDYYKTVSLEWKRKADNMIQLKARRKGHTHSNDVVEYVEASEYKSGWNS